MVIINDQVFDRLCNTVCACIEHCGHADKRSLVLIPALRVQLEVGDILKRAKGIESRFLIGVAELWGQVGNIMSNKLVSVCPSV